MNHAPTQLFPAFCAPARGHVSTTTAAPAAALPQEKAGNCQSGYRHSRNVPEEGRGLYDAFLGIGRLAAGRYIGRNALGLRDRLFERLGLRRSEVDATAHKLPRARAVLYLSDRVRNVRSVREGHVGFAETITRRPWPLSTSEPSAASLRIARRRTTQSTNRQFFTLARIFLFTSMPRWQ